MEGTPEMSGTESFKVIALFKSWSGDYWDEINHDDPEFRCLDEGPDGAMLALSATFVHMPTDVELQAVLEASGEVWSNCDGRFVLASYAVLDGAAWSGLVGPDQQGFVGQGAETPSPTIMHLGRLGTADGRVVRAGMNFVPYRASGDETPPTNGGAAC